MQVLEFVMFNANAPLDDTLNIIIIHSYFKSFKSGRFENCVTSK